MRGISWVDDSRLASQEGLCSMEWVSKYENNIYFATHLVAHVDSIARPYFRRYATEYDNI